MMSISGAIKRKYWEKWGIKSWNNLLILEFGKTNRKYSIWVGKEGLQRAINKILDYYEETGKKPTRRSPGFGGVVKAIQRGYWTEYAINSWVFLLDRIFCQNSASFF
jgi:hypothetical protein